MRSEFLLALVELAQSDKNIMLLTADLGFSVFEEFEARFPNQYINVGVAEQAMVGIAAGLAMEGKKVFTYSIGNFPTLRCLEQIRNDLCYHDLNVNIIGMGGGYSYGALGMSHHATEDVSIMCSLPNITVLCPTGSSETYDLVKQAANQNGVSYIRLEKNGYNDPRTKRVKIGRPRIVHKGKEIIILAIGGILTEVVKAAKKANKKKVFPTIVSLHTVKPFNDNIIEKLISDYSLVITVEENNLFGGLGSLLANFILAKELKVKLKTIGINDRYMSIVGDQDYLRRQANISDDDILNAILDYE
ncbi:transketolase [Candidatus Pseudothioglobus singularis]|nr:transketolase C-terminal domain-containing protein [Candidatus Pseudothioglobus singularis]MDB4598731.1 transketolase [Candidatus Pseudothioglobus singularis]